MARPYAMEARAQSAAATRRRVLEAARALLRERPPAEIRLQQIAGRAEVSVQTVLRIFGSRGFLLEQAGAELRQGQAAAEVPLPPGDVPATVARVFDQYEALGELAVQRPRAWYERQLAPQLARHPGARRERVLNAVLAACGAGTWKLLRRELGLERAEAEATVRRMVTGALGG